MAWAEKHGGRYRGRYRDADQNRHTAGYSSSKRAALRLAQEAEIESRRGTRRDKYPGTITFAEYFEKHWLPHRIGEVATIAAYRSNYNAALSAYFGLTPIEQITTTMIQQWVATRLAEGSTAATVRAHYRTLATVLGAKTGVSAVRDGLIAKSPCEGIDLPAMPPRDIQVYSVQEVDRLVQSAPPWWRPLIIVAVDSGLRWGELMGLQVSDLGPNFETIKVRRSLIELPVSQDGSPFLIKPYPKGRQIRSVTLTREAAEVLRDVVDSLRLSSQDRLFSVPNDGMPHRTPQWPSGLPIRRSVFRTSVWIPAHRAAALEVRRFHDLRATHITWLLSGGADVAAVMRRVGHSRLSTTQGYLGALPDSDARAAEALTSLRARYRT